MNYNFNFSCGKSVCDIFLRQRFIGRQTDPDMKTRILQECEVQSFPTIVATSTIELSKKESEMIIKPSVVGQTIHQINYRDQGTNYK